MELVITGSPSVIVNVTDRVPLPPALVAETVTEVDPTALGVPEMTPVLVFNVSPAGSPGAPKLVGLSVPVMV